MAEVKAARAPKSRPATYWHAWVSREGSGSASAQGYTLSAMLADAFRSGTLMMANDPRQVTIEGISELCRECSGQGCRWVSRSKPRVRCKACRGVGTFATLDPIPLRTYPYVACVRTDE